MPNTESIKPMANAYDSTSSPFAVVVNDDQIQLKVLSGFLRKTGLEVRTFIGAEDALEDMCTCLGRTDTTPGVLPAIIITDIYMPGLDGWRFCSLLRSHEYAAFNKIPIIVVSATYSGDEPNRIAADLGVDAFMPSSVDGKQFIETVEAILRGSQISHHLHALIVDDCPVIVDTLKKNFESNGYIVDIAYTVKEATLKFVMNSYDVAVIEYHLSDGMGDALLDVFNVHRPECVSIMMTSDSKSQLSLNWMKRGAAAFILKPFEPEYLIELCIKARRESLLLRGQYLLDIRTRELKVSEDRYRTLFREMLNGFALHEIICDEEGKPVDYRFLEVNPAFEKMTGLKSNDIVGKTVLEVLPDTESYWIESYGKIALTGEPSCFCGYSVELNKYFEVTAFRPVSYQFACIFVDITDRMHANEDRKKLQDQLNQAQRMEAIGTLAGGIAHDFNNILFPIMGHTELLLFELPEDSPFRRSLDEIYSASMRAKDLVNQILTFARQEHNEIKLIKIQYIIKETLKLIRSGIPTTIEIKHNISASCPPIKADPTQIHQIIMNLTTNAYLSMEKTGGQMKVSLQEIQLNEHDLIAPDMIPGCYACLTVSDTGVGMDKDLTEKIFNPFFTTRKKDKGTGLGLSVVHGIVKRSGGNIQVLSEPGKGTEIRVYLPIVANNAQTNDSQPGVNEVAKGGSENILLVDDEESIIKVVKRILERLGYNVTSHGDSLEALEDFRANPHKFDIVVTDMTMPNMAGDKLAVELIKIRSDIPILLCTGFSGIISDEEASSIGIKGIMMKPIESKEFARKIRDTLNINKVSLSEV